MSADPPDRRLLSPTRADVAQLRRRQYALLVSYVVNDGPRRVALETALLAYEPRSKS
mgnify:CR=1 FL=1